MNRVLGSSKDNKQPSLSRSPNSVRTRLAVETYYVFSEGLNRFLSSLVYQHSLVQITNTRAPYQTGIFSAYVH